MPSAYEEDLVELFRDQLEEVGPTRLRRIALLVRAMMDAARHGTAAWAEEAASQPGHQTRSLQGARRGMRYSGGFMDGVFQDLRFTLRSFGRRPLFVVMAVATLGLGIGGTTAMFSVVDGVLIRDLAYRDPETLVSIWRAYPDWRERDGLRNLWDHVQFTWTNYISVRDHATTLSQVAASGHGRRTLVGEGGAVRVSVGRASANLFDVLGVRPFLGRSFLEEEVPPRAVEGAKVVILSHELWTGRLGSDPNILHRTIQLDEDRFMVVGVLPEGFRFESSFLSARLSGGRVDSGLRDVWVPLPSEAKVKECGSCLELLGRVAPGHTIGQARDEVQTLLVAGPENQLARVVKRKDVVTDGFSMPLLVLLGGAGIVLLIACVNVAGLLSGEAPRRLREVSIRSALGAGRRRVIRQLLTENIILGLMGGGVGILIAWLGTQVLLSAAPPLPRLEEVRMSWRVLALALATGAGTGILFGLSPSFILTRSLQLRAPMSGGTRVQAGTLATQVGLTVLLLIGFGLFGRSMMRVRAVDPGFDPENLATLEVSLPFGAPHDPQGADAFFRELVRATEGVDGVSRVSATQTLPFPGNTYIHAYQFERDGQVFSARHWGRYVLPSYHETLGIPLLMGRLLSSSDAADAHPVVLVSESLAQENWPGESPLGRTIRLNEEDWTVVGVVGDVSQGSLRSEADPTLYVSTAQFPRESLTLVARTSVDPGKVLPALREAIWSVNPDTPIGTAATLTELVRASEAEGRFRAVLASVFATLATLLAAVGIFGVTARSVEARKREIGIRTALGAGNAELIGMAVRRSLMSAGVGTALGLLAAAWAAGLISHLLFGIEGRDPVTFAGVAGVLLAVSLAASYLPARRATKIQPMRVIAED
jgi:predicted permease